MSQPNPVPPPHTVPKGRSTLPVWLAAAGAAALGYYLYNNSGNVSKIAEDIDRRGSEAQQIGRQVDQKIYDALGQGKEKVSGVLHSGQKEYEKRKEQVSHKAEEGKKQFSQFVNEPVTKTEDKATEEKKGKGWFS